VMVLCCGTSALCWVKSCVISVEDCFGVRVGNWFPSSREKEIS